MTHSVISCGSTTYWGNDEMIEYLCGEDSMDSHYYLYLLLLGNTKKIMEILNEEFSDSTGEHGFTFYGITIPDGEPLPIHEKGESIEAFTISSYRKEKDE